MRTAVFVFTQAELPLQLNRWLPGQPAGILSHAQEKLVWESSTNLRLVCLEMSPHENTLAHIYRTRSTACDCKLMGPGDKGLKFSMLSLPQSLLLRFAFGNYRL